jgi:drug/metabolite transporter (DMT)-like permease
MQRDIGGGERSESVFRPSARPTLSDQPLKAIGLICLAVICFSATDTTGKYMITAGQLPVTQVVWVRFLGQFVAIVVALGLVSVPSLLVSRKPGWQLLRSCLLLAATVFNFLALRSLRLDQAMTIQFLTPLTVALLAGPILGEWVGWRRLIAILVGFCGVVVAVRPGRGTIEIAFLWSALSMTAYACFTLLTRHLASHDGVPVTLFYSLLAGVALAAPFAFADWHWPQTTMVWMALLSCGVWAAIGHALFIAAFRFSPASTIAPFTYFGLVSHVAAGYFVFAQTPDFPTLAGASIVIGSGLYLLHRERLKSLAARSTQE